nr:MAG TPA: hypothetical protein [Caudoviricetes sp.]
MRSKFVKNLTMVKICATIVKNLTILALLKINVKKFL